MSEGARLRRRCDAANACPSRRSRIPAPRHEPPRIGARIPIDLRHLDRISIYRHLKKQSRIGHLSGTGSVPSAGRDPASTAPSVYRVSCNRKRFDRGLARCRLTLTVDIGGLRGNRSGRNHRQDCCRYNAKNWSHPLTHLHLGRRDPVLHQAGASDGSILSRIDASIARRVAGLARRSQRSRSFGDVVVDPARDHWADLFGGWRLFTGCTARSA